MKSIDVIIVNYNSTDFLLGCLKSLFDDVRVLSRIRVHVIDNASKDNVDRVSSRFPQVVVTKNEHNVGFARALNCGLRQSSAPYILILNPDTIVRDGFLESVLGYMEEHPDGGIVGPKILGGDGVVQGSARSHPTPLTAFFGRTSMLTRLFPNNPVTTRNLLTLRSDGVTPMTVDWVSGACMVVCREVLEEVGLLDENFFMYWEDADWCRRTRSRGWKVVYFPPACVVHYVGVSSDQAALKSILEFHKSIYWLFHKYSTSTQIFLEPFVIAGLSLRAPFVFTSTVIRLWASNHRSLKTRRKSPAVVVFPKDRRIKILRMIARLNVGGPSIHVHILTKGVDKTKFHTVLVAGKISTNEGDMSYLFDSHDTQPIIISQLQREISIRMDLKAFLEIFKILRRENPDIVHTHTAKAGTSSRLAVFFYNLMGKKKVRMVHTFHGNVFAGYFGKAKSMAFIWIERLLAKETDMIIAVSEGQKKELADTYRIALPEKIRAVKLGFDLDPFLENGALKGRFRRTLGIDDGTLLIAIVGRLVPIKNHFMFFRAGKRFVDQNPQVRVRFAVVGDGELREDLEAYCKQIGLSGNVTFCGWMRDLPMVYADTDILALTSINEGTPVSIIEAMASSVPVVSTDAGGVLDLLGPHDGIPESNGFRVCQRGILCRKDDDLGFAKALAYVVGTDPCITKGLTRRGRSFVKETFSAQRLLRDMEALYLELMGRGYGHN